MDVLAALVNNLAAILMGIAAVLGAASALISVLHNSKKIDENTTLTRKGIENAASAADRAEKTAVLVNGHLDDMVRAARSEAYALGFEHGKKSVPPNAS